ncbi:hypothetical protein EAG_02905 [Camponotus floridanus]|uniref:Uncharacterized protein n=1 Tax=Camponotus floridanus TaxID=104421 RepID=E1ZVS8_CAMFO|nr:hypothetical protein EAG_02905 [Camponotus floridanus]
MAIVLVAELEFGKANLEPLLTHSVCYLLQLKKNRRRSIRVLVTFFIPETVCMCVLVIVKQNYNTDNDESIDESNDLRSVEAIDNKSIDFEKSIQLFTDMMDSKMLYQESNTELNVEFSNNNKYSETMDIDDSNDSKSMHYDESIVFDKSVQSFPDTMDSDIQEMQYQVSNTHISNVENGVEDDEYFVVETIEKGSLNKDDIKENLPEGRRIVDFAFLWKEIRRESHHLLRNLCKKLKNVTFK